MGYLVNKAVDRMLELDSIDIYGESTRSPQISNISTSSVDNADIERVVKSYVDSLNISSIDAKYVIDIVNTTISELLPGEVKAQVEPLADLITELEAYTRSQIDTLRNDLKKVTRDRAVTTELIANPTTPPDKDPSVKSWAEFFKMIGMDALTATEAQKKENIDTRTQQIEQGLQAATEQVLGEWAVKIAGRSFVRVGN
jgi:hypothetical protein